MRHNESGADESVNDCARELAAAIRRLLGKDPPFAWDLHWRREWQEEGEHIRFTLDGINAAHSASTSTTIYEDIAFVDYAEWDTARPLLAENLVQALKNGLKEDWKMPNREQLPETRP